MWCIVPDESRHLISISNHQATPLFSRTLSPSSSSSLQETYIEIQTEHLPQLLLRMVSALTSHLPALGLGELTHCLRLCSKILSKVQPPLVSPLSLPTGPLASTVSAKEEKRVRSTEMVPQPGTPIGVRLTLVVTARAYSIAFVVYVWGFLIIICICKMHVK